MQTRPVTFVITQSFCRWYPCVSPKFISICTHGRIAEGLFHLHIFLISWNYQLQRRTVWIFFVWLSANISCCRYHLATVFDTPPGHLIPGVHSRPIGRVLCSEELECISEYASKRKREKPILHMSFLHCVVLVSH